MKKCFLLFLVVAFVTPLSAREIIPPFGLQWGETSALVQLRLEGANARIVEREEKQGRSVWTVEGLVHTGLKQSKFYFENGHLVAVELQYLDDRWEQAHYDRLLRQMRQRLDRDFGRGSVVARERKPEAGVMQTFIAYQWKASAASVQMVYFAAEKNPHTHRVVSVHYRGP